MKNRNDDFTYFKDIIFDSEIDSSPLADFETEGFEEGEYYHIVSDDVFSKLEVYCNDKNIEPIILAKTACCILLEKYTNNTATLGGVTIDGHLIPIYLSSEKHPYLEDYIASFQTQQKLGQDHMEVGFEELCSEFELRSLPIITDEALFFNAFSLTEYQDIEVKLCLFFSIENKKLTISVKYNQRIYSKETLNRLFLSFNMLLKEIVSGTQEIAKMSILSDELLEELESFYQNEFAYDDNMSVVDCINCAVAQYGKRIAIVYKDKQITYQQFGEMTDRIGQYVQFHSIAKEEVVSILMPRCAYFPIAAVGVSKAGAAYQPLDPSYPPERLNFMMKDANTKLLIADKELLSLVPDYKGAILTLDEIEELPECTIKLHMPTKEDLFILLYTSGSTGVPKGVMLEHRNLVAFLRWYQDYYHVTEESRIAAYASFGFDASMMDIYTALVCGAQVHIIEETIRLELLALNRYFIDNKITHSFMTTQVGRQYADMFADSDYPHYLSVGGETLVPIKPPKYNLYNAYGPTECTIFTTIFPIDKLYQNVPIGKPLYNMRLYVTDRHGNRLPVGVAGELWVSGPQVARGYLNRPDQNQKVFIKNHFTDNRKYDRIYRTGDIVRLLPNGCVEFIGRRDSQVKIRGFRIELSEVEQVIREFVGIKDATVAAFDEVGGGKYIAAYVVSDEEVDIEALNKFILKTKPPYMVPAVTMQIDKIPLNQNQKVNKRALPIPQRKSLNLIKPENEVQEKICHCLSQVIGHKDFGITTDFYSAGLTSIAAIKFVVLLSQEFSKAVSIKDLKENNTAQKLEKFLSVVQGDIVLEKRNKYPLTQTQLGIYVECMMDPNAVFYNLPGYFALDAETPIDKLCESVKKVIHAHPSVKCKICTEENGDTFMYPQDDRDVSVDCLTGTEEEFENFFKSFAKPFDLKNGPLYRLAIYRTNRHVYLVTDFHHIISDGTSIAIFIEELNRVWHGQEPVGERYTQFDLAVSEEKALQSEAYSKAKAYYDSVFIGASGCTVPDRDRWDEQEACGFYRQYSEKLSYDRVQKFCRKNRITPNIFFLSVMGYVLGKYANTEESYFTTVYNGRNDGRTGTMMGMLVKTLPVLCALDEQTEISHYLSVVQDQLLSSMSHDIYSFAQISRAYHIQPDIIFVYQGDDFVEFELGDQRTVFEEGVSDKAKAKISINIFVEKETYRYEFEYRKDWYSEAFIERMFEILVEAANSFLTAKTLGDVHITSQEQIQLIESFNQTDYPVELVSVNKLFERIVEQDPNKTAVIANGESLTYGELNRLANRLAYGLLRRGLKPDTIVGLILEREKSVYIVHQGILKAGGAFLPMVPEYPDDRIDFCLKDAQCPFVITSEKLKKERLAFWKGKPYKVLTVEELITEETLDKTLEQNPNLDISVDTLAYCLYTSGSTGKPKGVMIEHRNLCNFVNYNPISTKVTNYVDNGTVSLALAAITFDVSVMEEFIPLCNGMTICMANEEEIHNPIALAELLTKYKVDIMKCTPSYMTNIIEVPQMRLALAKIKAFDIGAETFPPMLYDKMREVNQTAKIVNSYGPTECTISSMVKLLDDSKEITIGNPLTNMKVYVVNRKNKILPVDISGELIICGSGVGRGYVNLPEKNKAAFFSFKGMKAYHSGDLVRWNSKGEIVFLGRLDNQVKIRGLRIELDEIESAINSFESVKMSKVIVCNNGSEDYLAGYFTATSKVDKLSLMDYLKSKLTAYMVPNALMQLDEMPLTVNGKIDKKQLPVIQGEVIERNYIAPSTELEKEFCDQFAEILKLEKVGVTDNFFEIGGTSLSATRIAMYAMTKGYAIVYKDIFANPTPAKLAAFITQNSQVVADSSHIQDYDYTAIEKLLAKNSLSQIHMIKKSRLGNILLTGATGFLGIHILHEFLTSFTGKVYCMVRKGSYQSCEKRLMHMLMYYFGRTFEEEFKERIECIDEDITNLDKLMKLGHYDFTTIINCAACVKHFVHDDILDKVNVEGVRNIIALCQKSGKRLIHISTTSVAGEGNELTVPITKQMHENELYFGQIIENDYIRTKFLAERFILEECARGRLDAKIIRVGNLMSRKSDGEFQINFITNGFMRTLNAYRMLGQFPIGSMHAPAEFSPIDSTAAAIITLAASENEFTIFHAYNSHKIYMSDVIYAMNQYGFKIEVVPDETFEETLRIAAGQEHKSDAVLGLIAYASDDENKRYEIKAENRFTVEVLYRLGYKWPITDDRYLKHTIRALDTLGFFE